MYLWIYVEFCILGNEQADWAGRALAESKISFTRFIQSGLIRAIQTATIINKHLRFNKIEQDIDLNEGYFLVILLVFPQNWLISTKF